MGRAVKTLSVVIVHPEPALAQSIASAVAGAGHRAIVVPDGERAIDRFIQEPADALVVEMVLPGRDGGTTVESIRWAPGGDGVAVILLGTRGTPAERLDAVSRQVGALAALAGPPNLGAIQSLLAGIAGPQTSETRVARSDEIDSSLVTTREHEVSLLATTSQGMRAAPSRPGEDETYADEELSGHWEIGDDPNAEQEGAEVERHARLVETVDALHGDLSATPFPVLLNRLADHRATGALIVSATSDGRRTTTGESPKKVVYFRAGVPVYVRSNLVQECLGQVLARGGHISQHVLEESVQRMRAGEGRQGGVLVAMGVLSPHELREALEDQLRVKLFDLFAWTSGGFRFDERAHPPAETVTLEMSMADIVLKGVVHRVPPQRLLELLAPELERYVVPVPARLEQFRAIEMAPVARRVLMSLDGMQRLRELLGSAGNRPGAAAQLIYALSCAQAVVFHDEPYPTPRLQERRKDTPERKDVQALREELTRVGRLLREERYAEALGVDGTDAADAYRASERLAARFRRVTEPGAAPRDLRALAYEVCARLVHAQKALAGSPSGSQAGTSVEKPAARTGSPGGPFDEELPTKDEKSRSKGTNEGERAGHDRPTRQMDRSEVETRLPIEEEAGLAPAPVFPDAFDDEENTVDHADDMPTPDVTEPPPISVEASLSSASAEPALDPSEPQRPGPDPLDARVDKLFRAERHFRRGEKALGRHRVLDAVDAFERAVALCPEEGEFIAHLGYARYQAADAETHAVERAMQELERACRLAPKLDITHLLLARVLEDLGETRLARDAYERALAANPDCVEALEGLRGLSARRM